MVKQVAPPLAFAPPCLAASGPAIFAFHALCQQWGPVGKVVIFLTREDAVSRAASDSGCHDPDQIAGFAIRV